jgi:two-component system, sensor histidine kinase and response regulator
VPPAAPNGRPAGSLLDWAGALKTMQGDAELLLEVIDAHLMEAPMLVDQLRAAIASQDVPAVRRLAHTIKGNLRALNVHEPIVAAQLEADAAKADLSRAAPLLEEMLVQLEAVNEELREHVRQQGAASQ